MQKSTQIQQQHEKDIFQNIWKIEKTFDTQYESKAKEKEEGAGTGPVPICSNVWKILKWEPVIQSSRCVCMKNMQKVTFKYPHFNENNY